MSESKGSTLPSIKISNSLDARPTAARGEMIDALANNPDLAEEMADRAEHKTRAEFWFNEWIKGNMMIPQSNLGTNIFILNALLQSEELSSDPHIPSHFSAFRFTPEQRNQLGAIMSNVHHAKNIKVATGEHTKSYDYPDGTIPEEGKTHDKVISSEALDELWNRQKGFALNQLVSYVQFIDYGHPHIYIDGKDVPSKINDFLTDPKYAENKKELTNLVAEVVQVLQTPEGKTLTAAYRNALNYSQVPDEIIHAKEPSVKDNPDYEREREEYERTHLQHPQVQAAGKPLEDIVKFTRNHVREKFAHLRPFYKELLSPQ